MADEAQRGATAPAIVEVLRARLWSRLLLLLAVIMLLVVLCAAGQLGIGEAILSTVAVFAFGVIIPDTGETAGAAASSGTVVTPGFVDAVRLFADALPEPARIPLMELLAETFERDAAVRRDGARAQQGVRDWFADLRRLLGLSHETDPGRDAAG